MLRNSIKIIIRQFWKNGVNSAISVIGLGLGLALSLIVFMYVQHESSYDQHFKDVRQMYRVYMNSNTMQWARSLLVIGDELVARSPYVDQSTSFLYSANGTFINEIDRSTVSEKHILAVDSNFMDFFGLELVSGNRDAMLQPNMAFITEEIAAKYFGGFNPVGKVLDMQSIQFNQNMGVYTVAGVVQKLPSNTHFKYSILLSQKGDLESWINRIKGRKKSVTYTYVKVNAPGQLRAIKKEMQNIVDERLVNQPGPPSSAFTHDLQAVSDIHLKSNLAHELEPGSSVNHLLLILSVGIIVLFISLLNFIILHSSRILSRGKEIALKRISGADTFSLFKYFSLESIFYSMLSLQLAVIIIEVARPYLSKFLQIEMSFLFYTQSSIFIIIAILIMAVFIFNISAILLVRKLKIQDTLKLGVVGKGKGETIRRILTIIQFAVAIGLLVFSFAINRQLDYVQSKDLGFRTNNVLVLKNPDSQVAQIPLKRELLNLPGIDGVGLCNQYPTCAMNPTIIPIPGKDELPVSFTQCDKGFVKTMGIEVLETWKDTPRDHLLINEELYKAMKEAYENDLEMVHGHPYNPVGVVKDFHISSLHSPLEPFFLSVKTSEDFSFRFMLISYNGENVRQILDNIRLIWNKFYPGKPFDYTFIEGALAQQYYSEEQSFHIINIILVVILFIIGMGLFGTVSIMMKNRQKEMGIRKVLGASEVSLLINQIIRVSLITVIAIVIAWPVAWFLVSRWLMNFHYRTEVDIWIFVSAAAIVLLFSWLIIIWKVMRAVKVNPVNCLQYE